MTTAVDALRPLLTELGALVPTGDVVAELVRRLDEQALRVLVAGEAKRGKSTLVNALLGREILPTGVLPLTAVPTTVRHGSVDQLTARFRDGTVRELPLECLAELVTERGNPGNVRGVAEVTLTVPMPLLAGGLELVDTPGVGSVHAHNTAQAVAALGRMDAAVFVLTVDPPISASERAFLRQVRGGAVTVFCVLNKVDRLDPGEREQALRFTRRVVTEELGDGVPVFALSARTALAAVGQDRGFAVFRDAFSSYLATSGSGDLVRSVAAHAARLARSVAEAQQATLAALELSVDDLRVRLQSFREALEAVDVQRGETAAVADAGFDRLQADTDTQAAELTAQAGPGLLRDVAELVAAATDSPAAMEADALDFAAHRIRQVVGDWRTGRAAELDAAVTALDRRLTARLTRHVAAVRETAAQLFTLDLPVLPPATGMSSAGAFSYAFAHDPGQVDALAAAIRHRLPTPLARRQVTRHVAERTAFLLDKQAGRARAAFQAQLTETHRRFHRELDRRFADGAGRIADAVTAATELRTAQQSRVAAARTDAETVLDRARRLADRCDAIAADEAAGQDRRADRGAALT